MAETAPHGRARLLIVEGHSYLRNLLHQLLFCDGAVEVIAELESGMEAVGESRRLRADLILIDLQLPDSNGLAVTRMLIDMLPAARVILMINRPEYRRLALECGAADTIVKDRLSLDLSATLARHIARGAALVHEKNDP